MLSFFFSRYDVDSVFRVKKNQQLSRRSVNTRARCFAISILGFVVRLKRVKSLPVWRAIGKAITRNVDHISKRGDGRETARSDRKKEKEKLPGSFHEHFSPSIHLNTIPSQERPCLPLFCRHNSRLAFSFSRFNLNALFF